MATVTQIYNFVNDAREQAFGSKAPTVLDTTSLVSLGDFVFSSNDNSNRDIWWNVICDKIGRTFTGIREYTGKFANIRRDPLEYGTIIEKLGFEIGDAVENPSWTTENSDPFNISGSIKPYSKLFKSINTWERDQFITDVQLKKSFTSAESMNAFISGLFIALNNAMELEMERTSALAVDTFIATLLDDSNTNNNVRINLLDKYNTLTNESLTVASALRNAEFLKWASMTINLTIKKMSSYSTIFNVEGKQRFTPKEKLVVEMLSDFASATASYLESGTYHKELVALPKYNEVAYWQGSGESFSFEDISKINIKHGLKEVEQGGIVCLLHDVDAIASCAYDIRTRSIYNPRKEMTNYFKKAEIGYMADPSENGVVFYLAEV